MMLGTQGKTKAERYRMDSLIFFIDHPPGLLCARLAQPPLCSFKVQCTLCTMSNFETDDQPYSQARMGFGVTLSVGFNGTAAWRQRESCTSTSLLNFYIRGNQQGRQYN